MAYAAFSRKAGIRSELSPGDSDRDHIRGCRQLRGPRAAPGYKLHDRIIRPSQVIVSRHP
jgi:hypothetical protein